MSIKFLEIYNLKKQRLCILNNNSSDCATNIVLNLTINQVSTLTFDMPQSSPNMKYIQNQYLVMYDGQYYIIVNPTYSRDDQKLTVTIECKGLEYQLCTKYNFAIINNINVKAEVNEINKSAYELMDKILQDSGGWSVGAIDSALIGQLKTLQSTEQSIMANLIKIAELFNCFLNFNTQVKTVDLIKTKVDRHIQIRKGKNLKSINIEYNTSELITRLYPFGGNNIISGNEVSIIGVNPLGKEYIENYDWFLAQKDEYGNQLYTLAYINANPSEFVKEGVWRDSNYTDETLLYNDTVEKLKKLSVPLIKCNVTGVDLSILPEYFVESPIIGEVVSIIDEDLGISLVAQVTKVSKNSNNPLELQIEISNEIPYGNFYSALANVVTQNNMILDSFNEVKGSYISGQIDVERAKLNSSQSKWYTDESGALVFESLNGLGCLKLAGGQFGIASRQTLDGAWDYQAFGTSAGFTANLLKAGTLRGGKVDFNLETGVLRMGESDTNYKFRFDSSTGIADFKGKIYAENIDTTSAKITTAQIENLVVGTNVTMGANATISWGKIDGKPTIIDANTVTTISRNEISTATINANQINGGIITGCTLKTASDVYGDHVELTEQNIIFKKGTNTEALIGFASGGGATGFYFNNASGVCDAYARHVLGGGIWIHGDSGITFTNITGDISFSSVPKVGVNKVLTEASVINAKFA